MAWQFIWGSQGRIVGEIPASGEPRSHGCCFHYIPCLSKHQLELEWGHYFVPRLCKLFFHFYTTAFFTYLLTIYVAYLSDSSVVLPKRNDLYEGILCQKLPTWDRPRDWNSPISWSIAHDRGCPHQGGRLSTSLSEQNCRLLWCYWCFILLRFFVTSEMIESRELAVESGAGVLFFLLFPKWWNQGGRGCLWPGPMIKRVYYNGHNLVNNNKRFLNTTVVVRLE